MKEADMNVVMTDVGFEITVRIAPLGIIEMLLRLKHCSKT